MATTSDDAKIALVAQLVADMLDRGATSPAFATARRLGYPLPAQPHLPSPALFLNLCERSYTTLDCLQLSCPASRASRKAVLQSLAALEASLEAWRSAYTPPPPSAPPPPDARLERPGMRVRLFNTLNPAHSGRIGVVAIGAAGGLVTLRLEAGGEVLRVPVSSVELV